MILAVRKELREGYATRGMHAGFLIYSDEIIPIDVFFLLANLKEYAIFLTYCLLHVYSTLSKAVSVQETAFALFIAPNQAKSSVAFAEMPESTVCSPSILINVQTSTPLRLSVRAACISRHFGTLTTNPRLNWGYPEICMAGCYGGW